METVLPGPMVGFDQVRALDFALVFKGTGRVDFALPSSGPLMHTGPIAHELGVAELSPRNNTKRFISQTYHAIRLLVRL
jgi:hypothetical protein